MSTRTLIRLSKACLSLLVGLLASMVVFNNITDYWTNFQFVSHVMSMDTTIPDSKLRKRSVTNPRWYHLAYAAIIALESAVGWLCSMGGLAMLRALHKDGATFHEAKRQSILGLFGGLMLWFVGFQVLAAEWFAMWQSKQWDGLPAASRLTQIVSTLLVYVSMNNDE
jgi:predicted small integral membrane protein